MNLYFTYESRDTPNSFCLFINVKAINLKYNFKKLAVVVLVLPTTQNLVISGCCFAEDGKEMYKEL